MDDLIRKLRFVHVELAPPSLRPTLNAETVRPIMDAAADRIAELEAALREIKTRTYAYRGDDQNYPLAAGVYEVASAALQAR